MASLLQYIFKDFGTLPPEYDKRVHGYYDPARYYGKPDTPFSQVKLNELSAYFKRRNYHPVAMFRVTHRAYWRWLHKYYFPSNAGMVAFYQMVALSCTFFYIINSKKIWREANYKYH